MKRRLFSVSSLLLLGASAAAAAEPPLRICIDEAPQAPWRVADRDGRLRGNGLEFMFLKLLGEKGWDLRLLVRPWKRCLSDAREGAVDLIMAVSYTADRSAYLRYPMKEGLPDAAQALRHDAYSLLVPAQAEVQWDGLHLQLPGGRLVGVQSGYSVALNVKALGYLPDESSRTALGTLERLLKGQVQAAVVQRSEALYLMRSQPELARRLRVLEPELTVRVYYLGAARAFADGQPDRWAALQQAAVAVRNTPEYQRALAATLP